MKLYAFQHKQTGILAGLYHISYELYLVDGDCNDCPTFVGNSMEEMKAIFADEHEYIINDIDENDYCIVEFDLRVKLTQGNCIGTY